MYLADDAGFGMEELRECLRRDVEGRPVIAEPNLENLDRLPNDNPEVHDAP